MTRHVVELAGVAGAGKTTLATALCSLDKSTTVGVEASAPRLAAGMASAAPALVAARLSARGRWWTAAELRSLAYLHAWRGSLADRADGADLVLLDHGPVFRLAALLAYGPPMVRSAGFDRWWQRTCRTWARTLDAVVWLDAPDEVLLRRIHDRDRAHRVRGAGDEEVTAFLARYREAYDRTLAVLARETTPVVRVDTSSATPDEIASHVHAALDTATTGRPR